MLGGDERLIVVGVSAKQKREIEGERVTAIEHTDSVEALAELYSDADVLLNPTYEDTFPTVNIEAQACGCPVITYRTGGSPEMLAESTGIVVPRGDLQAMYRAVQDLKEQRIILHRDDAVQNAAQYTVEAMLGAYRELYERKTGE
jgi:glycosyltransferase involved in cell wall biosynthesis